jgi:uncharacterized protein YjbJ (UPF0337 family)
MSKVGDRVAGTTKKLVGEVLGDGKLFEEGDRQTSGEDTAKADEETEPARKDPFGFDEPT